jgi:hypothetical protein
MKNVNESVKEYFIEKYKADKQDEVIIDAFLKINSWLNLNSASNISFSFENKNDYFLITNDYDLDYYVCNGKYVSIEKIGSELMRSFDFLIFDKDGNELEIDNIQVTLSKV